MKKFPKALVDGYHNFLNSHQRESQFYRRLAEEGQKPEIMVIGCCDSRAAPEIIFQTGPGAIFVVRNIANQVPPYQPDGCFHGTSAALEYAVKVLKVKHIVVLGHGHCGGIKAVLEDNNGVMQHERTGKANAGDCCIAPGQFMDTCNQNENDGKNRQSEREKSRGAADYDFIGDWMQLLKPAVEAVSANVLMTQYEKQQALERISLCFSMENLRSFPWIKQAEAKKQITLHAAWFDIGSAELWLLDEIKNDFYPLMGHERP